MKKFFVLFYSLLIGISVLAEDSVQVDKKVLRSFKNDFPNAQETAWQYAQGTYIVSFTDKGFRTKASYWKDGTLVNYVRTYSEEHLPFAILLKVKEEFQGKKVFGVTELAINSAARDLITVEYYVKLEDDKNWMTVKFDDEGNFNVVEKYSKKY
jgi:hypothetical protein